MKNILILLATFNFLFYLIDYFILTPKNKNIPVAGKYNSTNMFSNLYHSSLYNGIKLIALVPIIYYFTPQFVYKTIFSNHLLTSRWTMNWLDYILVFLLADFIYYIWHVASHKIRLMWIGHQVHHQDTTFNNSTRLRVSVLEFFTFSVFATIPAVANIPANIFFQAYLIIVFNMGWLHCSNIKKLHPIIEFIFNTPHHHRLHHLSTSTAAPINCGGALIIWDRLFGTFKDCGDIKNPTYGVDQFKIHISPIKDIFHGVFNSKLEESQNNRLLNVYWHFSILFIFFSFLFFDIKQITTSLSVICACGYLIALELNTFKNKLWLYFLTFLNLILIFYNSIYFFPRADFVKYSLIFIFLTYYSTILIQMKKEKLF